MIKFSVFYPHDASFNSAYYYEKHIPMLHELLGEACKRISVDEGIGGAMPGQPSPFHLIAHVIFDSLPSFQSAFSPHANVIVADTKNYTKEVPPRSDQQGDGLAYRRPRPKK